MGRGMRAGKIPKERKKIEKAIRAREMDQQQKFVDSLRMNLEEAVSDTLAYHHNLDMIAMMFALHDEFGFGRSRLIRAIRKTCEHAERMLVDRADVDEMLEILKGETGIREEELTWDIKFEI